MFGTYQRLRVSIYASNRDVIAAARLKLKPKYRKHRGARAQRHAFYRQILEYHAKAGDLARHFNL